MLFLLQTRYFTQIQSNDQNFLKINLSKSEYDSIEPNTNPIKNNTWFMNIIRDGFQIFGINNIDDDLISISNNSNDSSASKEFYRSYQQHDGQNESFVCVIGKSAFNTKYWQNGR